MNTLKLTQKHNTTCLTFPDGMEFCLLRLEMVYVAKEYRHVTQDCSRLIILEPNLIRVLDMGECSYPTTNGALPPAAYWVWTGIDTHRLLKRVREIREKFESTREAADQAAMKRKQFLDQCDLPLGRAEINLDKFKIPNIQQRVLAVMEMAKHPNAKGDFAKTVAFMVKKLKPDFVPKLYRDLSRFLGQAVVYGNRDEFYFDGRKMKGGCGFNGGFILHGNEYGIHT